ncbi:MAG: hypothetical protein HN617_09745 [Planctomycetaceae bacterium]|nr:hypothetical protein [Planctomycetaceae bacterium]MBT4724233.1 hypothetical protein [Planctomycetaceae bacterium]MBT4844891.1 hypothetical protein [Planctomycetaceae bacterium]MBT5124869.1 hypothetical protein [Planctomycetaceae bacterium]MBT5597220.1 hypothetical protein [Planctomycetaceae bacterium]
MSPDYVLVGHYLLEQGTLNLQLPRMPAELIQLTHNTETAVVVASHLSPIAESGRKLVVTEHSPTPSNVPSVALGELRPRLAVMMDKRAIFRSVNHGSLAYIRRSAPHFVNVSLLALHVIG